MEPTNTYFFYFPGYGNFRNFSSFKSIVAYTRNTLRDVNFIYRCIGQRITPYLQQGLGQSNAFYPYFHVKRTIGQACYRVFHTFIGYCCRNGSYSV